MMILSMNHLIQTSMNLYHKQQNLLITSNNFTEELLSYYQKIDGLELCKHQEFDEIHQFEEIRYRFSYNHENNTLKVVRID